MLFPKITRNSMFPSRCSHPAWMNIASSTDSTGFL